MEKCKCYEERLQTKYLTDFEQGIKFAYTGERITQVNEVVAIALALKNVILVHVTVIDQNVIFIQTLSNRLRKRIKQILKN